MVSGAIHPTDISGHYYLDLSKQEVTDSCLDAIDNSQFVPLLGPRSSGKSTRLGDEECRFTHQHGARICGTSVRDRSLVFGQFTLPAKMTLLPSPPLCSRSGLEESGCTWTLGRSHRMLPQDEVGAATCGHSKVSSYRNCMYQYPATTISNGHSFLCYIHGAVEGRVEVPVGVLESAKKDFLAEKISDKLVSFLSFYLFIVMTG